MLVPDAFPVLITMPEPAYPKILRHAGVEDRVLLRALVTRDGRVDSASILAVQATYPAFVASAQQALSRARFRPARFGGRPGAAWITILIDFTLTREAT
jgi:protein TonB